MACAALSLIFIPAVWLAIFPMAFLLGHIGKLVATTEAGSVIYWVIRFMGAISLESLLTTAVFVCPLVVISLAFLSARRLEVE
jgi:hypothetical protein